MKTGYNFDKIMKRYDEPHRVYHNRDHIFRMLHELEKRIFNKTMLTVHPNKSRPFIVDSLREAILFHDIIFDLVPVYPLSNEQKSAMFYRHCVNGFDDKITYSVAFAYDLILATEFHFCTENRIRVKYENHRQYLDAIDIFLDLDLVSFHDDYEHFRETNIRILQERMFALSYPEALACQHGFLTRILDERLLTFRSHENHLELVEKANDNISQYLVELKSNIKQLEF